MPGRSGAEDPVSLPRPLASCARRGRFQRQGHETVGEGDVLSFQELLLRFLLPGVRRRAQPDSHHGRAVEGHVSRVGADPEPCSSRAQPQGNRPRPQVSLVPWERGFWEAPLLYEEVGDTRKWPPLVLGTSRDPAGATPLALNFCQNPGPPPSPGQTVTSGCFKRSYEVKMSGRQGTQSPIRAFYRHKLLFSTANVTRHADGIGVQPSARERRDFFFSWLSHNFLEVSTEGSPVPGSVVKGWGGSRYDGQGCHPIASP